MQVMTSGTSVSCSDRPDGPYGKVANMNVRFSSQERM